MPATAPAVGDEALQHWINRVRWHSDRAVLAGRVAMKAQDVAEEAAKKVVQMAGGILPDQLNLAAHQAQLRTVDADKESANANSISQDAMSNGPPPLTPEEQRAANQASASTPPMQRSMGLVGCVAIGLQAKDARKKSHQSFLCDATSKKTTKLDLQSSTLICVTVAGSWCSKPREGAGINGTSTSMRTAIPPRAPLDRRCCVEARLEDTVVAAMLLQH
eukprot:symbB.v1.2.013654.t1/scaffold966.1/size148232/7